MTNETYETGDELLRALCQLFGLEPTADRIARIKVAVRAEQDETGKSHDPMKGD